MRRARSKMRGDVHTRRSRPATMRMQRSGSKTSATRCRNTTGETRSLAAASSRMPSPRTTGPSSKRPPIRRWAATHDTIASWWPGNSRSSSLLNRDPTDSLSPKGTDIRRTPIRASSSKAASRALPTARTSSRTNKARVRKASNHGNARPPPRNRRRRKSSPPLEGRERQAGRGQRQARRRNRDGAAEER